MADEQAAAPAPAPAGAAAAVPAAKAQRPTNCAQCNKRLSRKAWYFRNGKYFCTKRCWKDAVAAQAEKAQGGAAA
ncbi:MAG: hypothetical protein HY597_06305 [Candidatus Omnitrophica bacterium]|nr:hypothetical protein [Candidatus Omnitrophota bacterium]